MQKTERNHISPLAPFLSQKSKNLNKPPLGESEIPAVE